MIRVLPNDPLTRLGCMAFCFPVRRLFPGLVSRFASVVDVSRDGARDSASGPGGATRSGRAPTDGVGVIADG